MHYIKQTKSFNKEDYLSPQASIILFISGKPLAASGPGTGEVTTDEDDDFGDDMDIIIDY